MRIGNTGRLVSANLNPIPNKILTLKSSTFNAIKDIFIALVEKIYWYGATNELIQCQNNAVVRTVLY